MPTRWVVEVLDIVEHVGASLLPAAVTFLAVRSVFIELKKLSMAELSQTSPALLMLWVMPCSSSNCWKCALVY
ncbi:hypothetical protein CTTA_4893 [Comamonas testosteroni]|uniref:Uncharacterized protein n=1 Tax=Comamonas testosteroni TaxID=285 RepID=A0A5A7MJ90_COMTE|nr:hypothetical protein CTR2_R41960 [Comamonas thiooxydans]GEQ77888.1 hypothetical protein CTTA_4893 [Comamonas testosteroni]